MTELDEAVADRSAEADLRRARRAGSALIDALDQLAVKQVDLVQRTGYARETIRRLVEDERIRRGEIPPTERYLRAQKRAQRS